MNSSKFLATASLVAFFSVPARSDRTNPDSPLIDDFNKRVEEYMKVRNGAKATAPAPKQTDSPASITARTTDLAREISSARRDATQGSIFTGDISDYFRRRIATAMQGQ